MIENDDIATMDGTQLSPSASLIHRLDERTEAEGSKDIDGGTIRQGRRLGIWAAQLNRLVSNAHVDIVKLAQPGLYRGDWIDPGDALVEFTYNSQLRYGNIEVESTPYPSAYYRIKQETCHKADRYNRNLLIIHPAFGSQKEKRLLWRVISPNECREWLKTREFDLTDPYYRGSKVHPFGDKPYTVLNQLNSEWIEVNTFRPLDLCTRQLEVLFASLKLT